MLTKARIRDWIDEYGEDGVYVSFSGGKDSTVLLDLVRQDYPNIRGVFVDTGLEYPEVRSFARSFDNIEILKPEMNFRKVIETYGYPMISKEVSQAVADARISAKKNGISVEETNLYKRNFRDDSEHSIKYPQFSKTKYAYLFKSSFLISEKCCNVMKKKPFKKYEKETGRKPILAMMAQESRKRKTAWLQTGCNAFEAKRKMSNPMAFWTEQDVLKYIHDNNIEIASVYGDIVTDSEVEGQENLDEYWSTSGTSCKYSTTGCDRTGCMFCGFGCQSERGIGRFERLKETHPKQYNYIMKPWDEGGLGFKEVIDWLNENGNLHIKY